MATDYQENIAVLHSIIDGIPDHLIGLNCFKKKKMNAARSVAALAGLQCTRIFKRKDSK